MASLFTSLEQYTRYIDGQQDNKITEYLADLELKLLRFLQSTYSFEISFDKSYRNTGYAERYLVKIKGKNKKIERFMKENGPFYIYVKK